MKEHKVEETFQELEKLLRNEHPDAKLEFSSAVFDGHAEFTVMVFSKDKYDAIREHCKALAQEYEERSYPIWIFARSWTGPWEGGESPREARKRSAEIRKRLKARLRQMKKELKWPSGVQRRESRKGVHA
ncbi:MAG: hypothetical protein ABSE73_20750 [Planctomycetota bacterium]